MRLSGPAPDFRRAVILDRDGTLVDVVRDEETGTIHTAFHPSQLRLLPGVAPGLRALREAGFALAVATNQPGPAKGQCSVRAVERTNQALRDLLYAEGVELAAFEVCLHHPTGAPGGSKELIGPCLCRKPQPGLLLRILRQLGSDPRQTWMIGDSVADLEAARAAGVHAALVVTRCELCPLRGKMTESEPELVRSRFDLLAQDIIALSGSR